MKFFTAHLILLAALVFLVVFSSGCASTEPDNASVRPWNSPEGWQSGMLGGMDYQHR